MSHILIKDKSIFFWQHFTLLSCLLCFNKHELTMISSFVTAFINFNVS